MTLRSVIRSVAVMILVLMIITGCSNTKNEEGSMVVQSEAGSEVEVSDVIFEKISPEDALTKIEEGSVILIDVRTKEEYAEGHIKTSINIPLDTLDSEISNYTTDVNQPLVVYCRSGSRSGAAAAWLNENGYTAVYDLGGIQNWPYEVEK